MEIETAVIGNLAIRGSSAAFYPRRIALCTHRVPVAADHSKVTQHASQSLQAPNRRGILNADWICAENGTAHLIDINRRLSRVVAVSYELGMAHWILGDTIALVEAPRPVFRCSTLFAP